MTTISHELGKATRILCILMICCAHASAATLFADNFNRPDNTNLNASTSGQSGILSTLNWVEVKSGGEPTITGSTLRLGETGAGGGWSTAYADHNFTDAIITSGGEFTVSLELVSLGSTGTTRFTGFTVGNSKAELDAWTSNNPTNASWSSDFFIGYDPSGAGSTGVYIYSNGTDFGSDNNISLSGGEILSVRFSGINDFNASSSINYEAFVDGGTAIATGSFTWSGNNQNYISLYSNYSSMQGVIDNFEVTAIPEPGSFLLGSLGLMILVMRRRR